MLVHVDSNSGVPVYRQIVDQLRFHISSGLLGAGDVLPSTRIISEQLGVNPMTVSKAFGILEAEGLLTHRPGRRLAVARINKETVEQRRDEQLLALLLPVAAAVRQLGITAPRAVAMFRETLLAGDQRSAIRKHA
jgi:GntR family transcriptional regulator